MEYVYESIVMGICVVALIAVIGLGIWSILQKNNVGKTPIQTERYMPLLWCGKDLIKWVKFGLERLVQSPL